MHLRSRRSSAILQALFVTFLWSTSWILIKIGLQEIPALAFAGLRYGLGFMVLAAMIAVRGEWRDVQRLSRAEWFWLILLGLCLYALTQGAQFLGLAVLSAVTVNLVLTLTTIVVALLGLIFLRERPGPWQWLGVAIATLGAWIYFYPVEFPADEAMGLVIAGLGMLFNALSALIGRRINRQANLSPRLVTTVSMGVGAAILFSVGIPLQGIPRLSATGWFIVVWLAVVNTAVAFTLWNLTLRTLTAVESSVVNNTMSIQIPILAVLFLGERPDLKGWFGLGLAAIGTLAVQIGRRGADSELARVSPGEGPHASSVSCPEE